MQHCHHHQHTHACLPFTHTHGQGILPGFLYFCACTYGIRSFLTLFLPCFLRFAHAQFLHWDWVSGGLGQFLCKQCISSPQAQCIQFFFLSIPAFPFMQTAGGNLLPCMLYAFLHTMTVCTVAATGSMACWDNRYPLLLTPCLLCHHLPTTYHPPRLPT